MQHRAGILLLLLTASPLAAAPPRESPFAPGRHGSSRLFFAGPVPVLHLHGTPAQMGEAAGTLLAGPLRRLAPAFIERYLELFTLRLAGKAREKAKARILAAVAAAKGSIPAHRLAEMEAMARAAEVEVDRIITANLLPEVAPVVNCSTVFIAPARMERGGPVLGRNLDYPNVADIARYGLVVVYHEKGRIPLATFTFPGFLGALTGINAAGLCGATMDEYRCSGRKKVQAMPRFLLYRELLGRCTDLDQVEKAVRGRRSLSGGNFTVVDAAGRAAVFEGDGESWHLRRPRGGMLYATNHFRSPALVKRPPRCRRYALLAAADKKVEKFTLREVKLLVKRSAQLIINVQAMLLLPRERRVLFAFGRVPAVLQEFAPLEREELFPPTPASRQGKEEGKVEDGRQS